MVLRNCKTSSAIVLQHLHLTCPHLKLPLTFSVVRVSAVSLVIILFLNLLGARMFFFIVLALRKTTEGLSELSFSRNGSFFKISQCLVNILFINLWFLLYRVINACLNLLVDSDVSGFSLVGRNSFWVIWLALANAALMSFRVLLFFKLVNQHCTLFLKIRN